jgi:rSAM/selenodomain-associated transferase 1
MQTGKSLKYADGKILVFARPPENGRVKTRLAKTIGNKHALEVYIDLLKHTVAMVCSSSLAKVEICVAGNIDHAIFNELVQKYDVELTTQSGNDLGDRMYNAISAALNHFSYCVIIGSDCPVMSADYIDQAFASLKSGFDAVIGPAEDGGYVLLAAKKVEQSWFADIEWGSQHVHRQTLMKMQDGAVQVAQLDVLWDIDTFSDFRRWERQRSTA